MKIGIIGDTHLGVKRFYDDSFNQFKTALSLLSNKVDVIIHTGDFFDVEKPSLDTLDKAITVIREANLDVPFISIYGNHEMRPKGTVNPVALLSDTGLLKYIHGEYVDVNKNGEIVRIFGLGYVPDNRFRDVIDELIRKRWKERMDDNVFKVLVIHQTIQDLMPIKTDFVSINELTSLGFDLVINGHIHKKVIKERFIMPGSTVVTSIRDDEIEPRGVMIHNTNERKSEFIELVPQRKIIYEKVDVENATTDEVEEVIKRIYKKAVEKWKEPIVRVKISGTLREGLTKAHIRIPREKNLLVDLSGLSDVKINVKVKEWNKIIEEKRPISSKINDLIESAVRDKLKIIPPNFYLQLIEKDEDEILNEILNENAGVAKSGQRRRA